MADTPWRRLSPRHLPPTADEGLVEGVPDWLRHSLDQWVAFQLTDVTYNEYGNPVRRKSPSLYRELERQLRLPLDWANGASSAHFSLEAACDYDEVFLDVIDYLLHASGPSLDVERIRELDAILQEGGSAWRVAVDGEDVVLQRRVDEATTAAFHTAAALGRPGRHLSAAWNAAFGRNPNPGEAYREAVRAVESAGKPIVSPKSSRTSLGTMIRDIRDGPTKWTVRLSTPDPEANIRRLQGMLELLWTAQLDRHGTDDESVPFSVTAEEAEAAVFLATTLVQWFTTGVVLRVP